MLDDPLDDPGDTCQPEVAPSDLDPNAEDNIPDPQDHSLYHLYDIQHAMGSVIKFRLERGTQADLATGTQSMASFWCLRPQFANTVPLYSPLNSTHDSDLSQC